MRIVIATCIALCGCSAIFDLQKPQRGDAAVDDAAQRDATVDAGYDAAVDAMPDAAFACPATYLPAQGTTSRYRLVTQNASWLAAATDCANDGATTHLAVASSAAELALLDAMPNAAIVWIGLSDLKLEGTYVAVTAEDTMGYPPASGTPWDVGEPNPDAGRDCVLFDTGELLVESCGLNREYFCECDAYANDPTRYQ